VSTVSLRAPPSIARAGKGILSATLMLGMMAQGLAFTAFVSALPQMAVDLGPNGVFIAQMMMALTAAGLMIGALASGWVMQVAGTRATMLGGLIIYGAMGALGMVANSPAALLAARFIAGFAVACLVTTCVWGIAAEFEGDQRARALGLSSSLANVSALTGTLAGGYLAQVGGWHLPFVQYPIFAVAGFLLAFVGIRQVRPVSSSMVGRGAVGFARLFPFYALAALLFAVLFMASTQYAFLLEQDGFRNPTFRSVILGTVTVVGALMAFVYGPLQRALTATGSFLFGLLCMTAALAGVGAGLTKQPALAVGCAVLMGIYAGLVLPYLYHTVTEKTPEQARGYAIGMLTASGFLGGFLNPVVFVGLAKQVGLRNVFWMVALVLGVLCIGTFMKRSTWTKSG
jgi:MFS family permease